MELCIASVLISLSGVGGSLEINGHHDNHGLLPDHDWPDQHCNTFPQNRRDVILFGDDLSMEQALILDDGFNQSYQTNQKGWWLIKKVPAGTR